ncbi:MAG TPA: HD-GYP domain-containing protein [Gemmatimonadales bacterium]|nr:HD-GYP domain-containing protein [Gemmatimonadales bacterium]
MSSANNEQWLDIDPAGARIFVVADVPRRAVQIARLLGEAYPGVETVSPAELLSGDRTELGAAAVVIESAEPVGLIRWTHELDPFAGAVLLTESIEGLDLVDLFRAGAEDVLPPPHTAELIGMSLARVLERRRERIRREERYSVAALKVVTQMLEAKDLHMAGHSVRVSEIAVSIATAMGRAEWEVERIRLAGRLHDIGMIAVPETLLARAGPLNDAEYAVVRAHAEVASTILAPFESLADVIAWIRGHHERWDGSGYPDGLAGEAIPWGARVLATAEIYDALATSRPYRSAMPQSECLARIKAMSGTKLDPAVHQALDQVVRGGRLLPFLHPPESAGRASIETRAL